MNDADPTTGHIVKLAVSIAGEDVTPHIVDCRVSCSLGVVDWFELRLQAWLAQQGQTNDQAVGGGIGHVGGDVKIEFRGVAGDYAVKDSVVFSYQGVVTEVCFDVDHDGPDHILLTGHGPMWALAQTGRFATFLEPKLSAVVKAVLDPHGAKASFQAKDDYKLRYLVQHGESDLDFLWRTCRQVGEWFYYDGKQLVCGWQADHGGAPVALKWGDGLRSCRAEMKVVPLLQQARCYHYPTAKSIDKTASEATRVGSFGDAEKLREQALGASKKILKVPTLTVGGAFAADKEAEDSARARTDNVASRALTLRGTTCSSPLQPGRRIDVKELGALSGSYRAVEVEHYFSPYHGYSCSFVALPSGVRHPPLPEIQPQTPSLQIGLVEDNVDPDKLGRVRVRLKWNLLAKKEELPWLRVMHHHAGADHGAYIVPEKGDEVLVGHEFDDPGRPIVLGSVYHGQAKPKSDVVGDKNDVKEFHTRSGNTIRITDKQGHEEIAISTPSQSNEIVLTAGQEPKILVKSKGSLRIEAAKVIEVEAGERMTLTAPKIEWKAKDLAQIDAGTLTAKASREAKFSAPKIEHSAQQEHKISAGATLKLSAATVELSAQAKLQASSGAVAEVSGGATLTCKAPLVRIN